MYGNLGGGHVGGVMSCIVGVGQLGLYCLFMIFSACLALLSCFPCLFSALAFSFVLSLMGHGSSGLKFRLELGLGEGEKGIV